MKTFNTSIRIVLFVILLILIGLNSRAQTAILRVNGVVTDSSGDPAVGVTVLVRNNSRQSTITDAQGRYEVEVSNDATLVFTSIGYLPQEIPVQGRSIVNVVLLNDVQALDEAVVIGYGTVKKRDLTGSVGSIRGTDLTSTNPVSLNQGLQGKLAGVNVVQSDGAPGAGISIQIRGTNSFTTSTEPLYVVDGIPYVGGYAPSTDYGMKQQNNPLSAISPQDILSIEVLKDASATAIYGSRGANGVVMITTRHGNEGRAKVNLSTTLSLSSPVKTIAVLNAADYARFRNEMVINGYKYDGQEYVQDSNLPFPIGGRWSNSMGKDPITGEDIVLKKTYLPGPEDFENGYDLNGTTFFGTNWQNEIFHKAFSKNVDLSVSGGDKTGTYMYSGGYLDQQGIITNSFYKRFTFRANNSRRINDFLEIGSYLSYSNSKNRLARTNSENFGVITSAISFNPTRPVFDPEADSGYSEDFASGMANPYLTVHSEKNLLESNIIQATGFANVKFTPWLRMRQNLSYYYSLNARDQYYNRYTGAGMSPVNGYAVKSDNWYRSLTSETTLTFDKMFGVNHINAVAGTTWENTNWGGKQMDAKNFPSDDTEDNNINAAIGDKTISSNRGRSQLQSFLFRINYGLLERYLFTVSFRRDGSSRLSPVGRWANFYSGAFAWRISEEPFMKNWGFFDDLKLRLSAGQTGNQSIAAYATRSRFIASNYPYNGSLTAGMAEDRFGGPAAPNLKWETTTQYNLGVDAFSLNNRIGFVIDLYYKNTKDLLQYKLIPMSSGFSTIATNYGNVENRGIEITGNFVPVRKSQFEWMIDANISFNQNNVYGLDADQFSDIVWGMESMFLRRNGQPIGTIYGYVEDGFYDNVAEVRANPQYTNATDVKVKSMVGQVKYKNLDDDPVIDDRDKTIIGNTNPDFMFGLTNTIRFKDWTLSLFFQGVKGNDILNVNLFQFDLGGPNNIPQFAWDSRWTSENRNNAKWPRPDNTYTRKMLPSDRYVEDGSYLRLKNLSLSYRLPYPFKYCDGITISASVSNFFTLTKYDWYDPDVNSFGSNPSLRGIDLSSYPSARTFTFGVNVAF